MVDLHPILADCAELVKVGEAVKEELCAFRSTVFENMPLTPVRSYGDWNDVVDTPGEFVVDVVPFAYTEEEADSRGSIAYVCAIDVGIRQVFTQGDRDSCGRLKVLEIDRLVTLLQEIHTFLFNRRLSAYEDASFREIKYLTTCSRDHLRQHNMYLGVVRVFYDVSLEVGDQSCSE